MVNLGAYRPVKPAPLDADELRRGHLYALVKQMDAEAAQHRRHGRHLEAEQCAQAADDAQREIESLYLL